ncbi:hypothetical protein B0H13DRAFT_2683737 [Mycena leptocephala]|nr:hypothetical protein B0H13DRAFT_2683737 [Mycena leptocephala]
MASSYLHSNLPAATCLSILSLCSRSRSSSPRHSSPGGSGAERLYEARRSPALSASAVRKNETVVAVYPPYCRAARGLTHPGVGTAGPVRRAGEHKCTAERVFAPQRLPRPLRVQSTPTGTPTLVRRTTAMVVLIPTTSARKNAVTKGKERAQTALLCAARPPYCTEETLDESVAYSQYRHVSPHLHPSMSAVPQAGGEQGARAPSVHSSVTGLPAATTTWERKRGYWRKREVFLRPDYEDADRENEEEEDPEEGGYARSRTGGDGEEE